METHANPVETTEAKRAEFIMEIVCEITLTNKSFRCIAREQDIPLNVIHLINSGRSKKYRINDLKYPLRSFSGSVTTIPAKGSRRATDTRAEREAP